MAIRLGEIRLDGQVAVVSGAGGGLGRSYAIHLAARGAKVVVNDIRASAAEAVVREIRASGGSAVADANSVSTPEGGRGIVATADDEFGGLEIVVANAGIQAHAPFQDLSANDVRSVLAVNIEGPIWLAQAAFPRLSAQRYGRIVLVTSTAGLFGHGLGANYCTSKASMVGLLRALALEGSTSGVLVNAVSPAAATAMTIGKITPSLAQRLDPALVAPAVVYLASAECTLNGEILAVGGGMVGRIASVMTRGWRARSASSVTAEAVRDHLADVLDTTGAVILKDGTTAATRYMLGDAEDSDFEILGSPPLGQK